MHLKSAVMSIWMLTTFGGNVLDAVITAINLFSGAAFFISFAVLMFCVAAVFVYSAVHYSPQQLRPERGGASKDSELQMQEQGSVVSKQRQGSDTGTG